MLVNYSMIQSELEKSAEGGKLLTKLLVWLQGVSLLDAAKQRQDSHSNGKVT